MKKIISILYILLIFALVLLLLAAGIFEAVTEPWDGFFNIVSNLSAIVLCTFFAFGYTMIAISKIKEFSRKKTLESNGKE